MKDLAMSSNNKSNSALIFFFLACTATILGFAGFVILGPSPNAHAAWGIFFFNCFFLTPLAVFFGFISIILFSTDVLCRLTEPGRSKTWTLSAEHKAGGENDITSPELDSPKLIKSRQSDGNSQSTWFASMIVTTLALFGVAAIVGHLI